MTTQASIGRALTELRPRAIWTLRGNTYADLEWQDLEQSVPTEEELLALANTFDAIGAVPAITKAQALLWLLGYGKTEADIDALIAAIPDAEQRAVAEIEWKYRQPFHYDHPLFVMLAPEIGISVEDLPAAFRTANTL